MSFSRMMRTTARKAGRTAEQHAAQLQRLTAGAANQEARAIQAEDALLSLLRAIHTAPMSVFVRRSTLPGTDKEVRLDAPHTSWRPLQDATLAASQLLARQQVAQASGARCGRNHPGPCSTVSGVCFQPGRSDG